MHKLAITLGTLALTLNACTDDGGGGRGSLTSSGATADDAGTDDQGSADDGGSADQGSAEDDGSSGGSQSGGSSGADGGTGTDDGGTTGDGSASASETGGTTGSGSASGTSGGSASTTGGASASTSGGASASTSSGSTSASGTTSGGIEPCQEEMAVVEPVPPRIMFVLDKSGSMMTIWDGVNTRWRSLHNVVSNTLGSFDSIIEFGLKLFPHRNSCGQVTCGACNVDPVEVPVGLNQQGTILGAMPAAGDTISGGTPMETGLSLTINYLNTLPTNIPRAMLLVADGDVGGGCTGETYAEALTLITNAWNNNQIPTYVVGIDASGTTDTQLNGFANAGGKPRPGGPPFYYQTTNQAELDQAMQDIVNDTLSCVVTINPEPIDPMLFEVWIGGNQIPEIAAADCATQNGWYWTMNYSEIEFCGTACDDLKTVGQVDTKYFCDPG